MQATKIEGEPINPFRIPDIINAEIHTSSQKQLISIFEHIDNNLSNQIKVIRI